MSKSNHTPTTPAVAARVKSAVAKNNGGQVPKGSYSGRMEAAANRNSGSSNTRKK